MPEKSNLFHPILYAAVALEERLRERLAPLGITPRQARILLKLDRLGTVSQNVLAEEFQVRAASMSTMTARLIANGFVTRQISASDKRANAIELTDKGRNLLTEVRRVWRDINIIIEQALGTEVARTHSKQAINLINGLNRSASTK
ncbi:transcriptional regulator SlyA [Roseivivax sp. THAF40]|uniref:MarR family winged helix-turn-helix transcriptional regulator n=1 Tax=unclassified Roseivivax TaxID=2639302 RepID=UPI0012AA37DE|nr:MULTISPECIES: MarR family transcriptional regulator [unclassified Roseivivax]QFS83763.1 transcriptional regulator SlyA [Roseivivax sp. THAF197b]QFT47565.1 transcriptional regulator SlyA [Roseivivax sp. THAF40]